MCVCIGKLMKLAQELSIKRGRTSPRCRTLKFEIGLRSKEPLKTPRRQTALVGNGSLSDEAIAACSF